MSFHKPLSRVTVISMIIIFTHVVRPYFFLFVKISNQNKLSSGNNVTLGLSERIINDSCLVINLCYPITFKGYWRLIYDHLLFYWSTGQPKVTVGRDHCFRTCCPFIRTYVRTSVPTFQNLTKQSENNVRYWRDYWVWPSGSLMTPVLYHFLLHKTFRDQIHVGNSINAELNFALYIVSNWIISKMRFPGRHRVTEVLLSTSTIVTWFVSHIVAQEKMTDSLLQDCLEHTWTVKGIITWNWYIKIQFYYFLNMK